jgi:Na+-transporting methylmalonyl-CoA/oxaloacetate decarboxylase gamma subunit
MENQVQWSEVIHIMAAGFGAVFVIMILLAGLTWLVGKVVQKLEKPKAEDGTTS